MIKRALAVRCTLSGIHFGRVKSENFLNKQTYCFVSHTNFRTLLMGME